jgi:antitoxin ParD1/3/4
MSKTKSIHPKDWPVEELRRLVQEGLDSGPGRYMSIEEIKTEAKRRFEETKAVPKSQS